MTQPDENIESRQRPGAVGANRETVLLYEANCLFMGGNQNYITLLFEHWADAARHPMLVCPIDAALPEAVRRAGGDVCIVEQSLRLSRYNREILTAGAVDKLLTGFALLAYNFRMYRFLRRHRPAVILCNNIRSILMLVLAAKACRIPLVWFIKGEMSRHYHPLFTRTGLFAADRIILLSPHLMPEEGARAAARSASKFHILRIGVDLDAMARTRSAGASRGAARRGHGSQASGVLFSFAGYLRPGKGVDDLIEAFAMVHRELPGARLRIIGDSDLNDYKRRLTELVAARGLDDAVHFLGWRDDVPRLITETDIFVLPSHSEGVPRSIVEAMACGVPVIATRVGGVAELLGDGDFGLIVPPRDPPALADAMLGLARNAGRRARLGRAGQEEVLQNYSITVHVKNLLRILRQAVSSAV